MRGRWENRFPPGVTVQPLLNPSRVPGGRTRGARVCVRVRGVGGLRAADPSPCSSGTQHISTRVPLCVLPSSVVS